MPRLNLLPPPRGGNHPSGNKPTCDSRPKRSAFGGSRRERSHTNSDTLIVPCDTVCGSIANAVKTAAGQLVDHGQASHQRRGRGPDRSCRTTSRRSSLTRLVPRPAGDGQSHQLGPGRSDAAGLPGRHRRRADHRRTSRRAGRLPRTMSADRACRRVATATRTGGDCRS